MCGIAGIFGAEDAHADFAAKITRMTDQLQHRGPNSAGQFIDARQRLGLGHRRLSIIDLSDAGAQPMSSPSGRYTIILNGEIYNFLELKNQLDADAIKFRGNSDTEVLAATLERLGIERTLKATAGMFALAIWDEKTQTLTLARDRVGEKPLYYGLVGGVLYFASELKAIRSVAGAQLTIDRDSLALYARYSYIPWPHCIFRELRKLPPASFINFNIGKGLTNSQPQRFWDFAAVALQPTPPSDLSLAGLTATLTAKIRQAVRRQMIADVPVGAFLSGGIDSTTVVTFMQEQSPRPVKTFTVGFADQRVDEARYARKIAAQLATDHTEIYLEEKDLPDILAKMPAIYDEPFADSSQIPSYFVASVARQSVAVSLSGDGGDELFSGYERYRKVATALGCLAALPAALRRGFAAALSDNHPSWRRLAATSLYHGMQLAGKRRSPARINEIIDKLAKITTTLSPASVYQQNLTHWQDPAALISNSREPELAIWKNLDQHDHQDPYLLMRYADVNHYMSDDILVKMDRAAMAVSLETRMPLLDREVIEFAFSIPAPLHRDGRLGKRLLREILYQRFDRSLIDRPKMGFGIPLDTWLRGPLRDWAASLLAPAVLKDSGFFDAGMVGQKWQEHQSGRADWSYHLWDIIIFQQWLQNGHPRP